MLEKIKNLWENKKLRSDLILISILLTISLSVFLFYYLNRTEGSMVVVSVNSQQVAEYPLSVDGTYYLNNGSNVMVIESGCVYVKEANCHGFQDCVESGKIRFVGEKIVCLPNLLIIEIVGEGEGLDI